MTNKEYMKVLNQHSKPFEIYFMFPFNVCIYKRVEEKKEEYRMHVMESYYTLSVKHFQEWLEKNPDVLQKPPALKYNPED
jgi:hypothetical protein